MLNGVSFRAGSLDSAKDILDQPQAFSRQQSTQGAATGPATDTFEKPKSKVLKKVIGATIGAAVIAAGLAVSSKFGVFTKGITKLGKNPTGLKGYAAKALAGLEKAGGKITEFFSQGLEKLKGLFGSKKPAEA